MSTSPDDCLKRADECVACAESSIDPAVARAWLEEAQHWVEAAEATRRPPPDERPS
jgi:hypothetical protein